MGRVTSDRFLMPWTFAGHLQAATATVRLPALQTFYPVVRACYPAPAGCFDAVVGAGVAVDSVAPETRALGGVYHERGRQATASVWWQHFLEVGVVVVATHTRHTHTHTRTHAHTVTNNQTDVVGNTRSSRAAPLYHWTLAPTPSGSRSLFPWKPLTASIAAASPRMRWNQRCHTCPTCLPHSSPPSFMQPEVPSFPTCVALLLVLLRHVQPASHCFSFFHATSGAFCAAAPYAPSNVCA